MRLEKGFDVRGVQAQIAVKAGLKRRRAQEGADAARFIQGEPFGVSVGRIVIPLYRGVDRHTDMAGMASLDLRLEQVEREMRMALFWVQLCVIVNPPVVTTGKAGDRIHPGFFECRGKLLGVELRADAVDELAGVKIKVNLAKT